MESGVGKMGVEKWGGGASLGQMGTIEFFPNFYKQ